MSTTEYVCFGDMQVAKPLHDLLVQEISPDSGVDTQEFWTALEQILRDFAPRIEQQLAVRDDLQSRIDEWHLANRGGAFDAVAYKKFLQDIGYLEAPVDDFSIDTRSVDAEFGNIPGAQLVVPVDNARFALNAANARWGSLYDALYGTDVLPETGGCQRGNGYNPVRGDEVVRYTRSFLDRHFALEFGSHSEATKYAVAGGKLSVNLGSGQSVTLVDESQFTGYQGDKDQPTAILLRKNNLHAIIKIDASHPIGKRDHASVSDVELESAVTTIMDCEDSVASVDCEDKVNVYRNWLGLMKGTLQHSFTKGGKTVDRRLQPDRTFTAPDGSEVTLHGRSVLLVRNVGTQLYMDAVKMDGKEVPEALLDAMFTSLCAKHNLGASHEFVNSRKGSVYIVKPKMHGSDEVALANELFERVETALKMPRNTLKIGIMDEERRTTVNLKNCIAAARERVVFINTGFLDRTGDDIHTSMEAGPMLPKSEIKQAPWLLAYEDSNVDVGLSCGLHQRAQIGKGMWAMPDEMDAMIKNKIQHLKQGGSTAWVPSPTAATLHAMHYFMLDVSGLQERLKTRPAASLDDILTIPMLPAGRNLSADDIQHELDNNLQGILGYVARWVGQGIGCSKVLDINNVALMEDCATLRISSQHVANWLHHGILTEQQVIDSMKRLAEFVDLQNRDDKSYQPMALDFDNSVTFQASLDLALKGRTQANGYTEFILYKRRQQAKGV